MNNLQIQLAAALKEVLEAREAHRLADFAKHAAPRRSRNDNAEYARLRDIAHAASERDYAAEAAAEALLNSIALNS